ncbi:hypothetical protein BC941DRAFT_510388 [Chlamydoabsidia padenii]|nr:hypothetical protein BC941DRAFT_510388 [Chlamydoabsidia padenii]
MDRLPVELIEKIIKELTMSDMYHLASINQSWHRYCLNKMYECPQLMNTKRRHNSFFKCTNHRTQAYIRHLRLDPSLITNEQLGKLTGCTGLVTLELSHCPHINPESLNKVLESCLTSIHSVTLADGKLAQSSLALLGHASRYFQLRQLDLSNTMIRPCGSIDTPHHLDSMIFDKDNALHDLNLSYCSWVDDTTLWNITTGLPFLKSLKLRFCHQLSDLAIKRMVQHLKQMSSVDVCHIPCMDDPAQVHGLMTLNPFLETIRFTHQLKPISLSRR